MNALGLGKVIRERSHLAEVEGLNAWWLTTLGDAEDEPAELDSFAGIVRTLGKEFLDKRLH